MKEKISSLRSKFTELNVDAIYLTCPVSHRYLTKFDNPDGALLITKENAYAFEDFRYTETANEQLKGVFTVIEPHGKRKDWLGDIIKKEKVQNLGIENLHMNLYYFDNLKKDLDITFVGIGSAIEAMREVKDEWEIENIIKAQKITDDAFSHIVKVMTPDMTENDVAAELEYFMRKHGAEDKSFETIAVSGKKSSMPHGVPSSVKLQKGFLTMDFGAVVNGYHSDMTRTVCIGKADGEMKKLYNTVLEAQLRAIDFIKAGVNCQEADGIAREIIYKDYKGCFGHSLGHGVGLEIHERPNLSPNFDKILKSGNVVTVEPGIYIAGKYGCRIEDMGVVRDGKIDIFTRSPKELIELF